jgi:hypothetical protein
LKELGVEVVGEWQLAFGTFKDSSDSG